MTQRTSRRRRRWGWTAVLAGALVIAMAPAVLASASPGLPAPRVTTLAPRVAPLAARVASLQPRVLNVAPRQTAPNAFTINTDVLFAFDRSDLSVDAQSVLASVVRQLHAAKPGTVSIIGYTDSIGDPTYNIGLSQRRAASVQTYLQAKVANPGLSYQTQGRGEADPVAPNTLPNGADNPAGRQQNRRVVITYTSG